MASAYAVHWELDPAVDFLNHGSFGATPRPVLEEQAAWRLRMEREPVRFMTAELEPALDAARRQLAAFVGAGASDLAFVTNTTEGVNAILRSLSFGPGDELLTTSHEYNAIRNALEFVGERDSVRVVVADVPFPIGDPGLAMDAVLAAVTRRTRLAVLDHVTSATALVLPVATLVRELAARGVESLIDGAHAPGQVELDIAGLGCTYYVANLHKWVCAPKGAAFMWVDPARQDGIRPLTISHGANAPRTDRSRFRLEFDWTGTRDPSAWLAVPAAIRFGADLLRGGWPALRRRNHELCLAGRRLVAAALDVPPPAPEAMIGCMAAVPMGANHAGGSVQGVDLTADLVHAELLAQGIQVMITPWPARPDGSPWRRLVRISAAAYNDLGQYERLAAALRGMEVPASLGQP
jgi:isopenicillin-N epimerase